MRVAVCIVGFRDPALIAAALDALDRSTHRDFEVVLCENGGRDAHARLARRLPAATPGGRSVELLPFAGNPGFAGGVNRCMRARPDADAWYVLNPDARPEPGALAALVARLARGDVDAAGGVLLLPDGRVQGHGGVWRPWLARAVSIGRGDPANAPPPPGRIEPHLSYLLGASMLIGRRFVERAGLMREDYFLYGEEVEWFLRARARGLRLGYAPDAVVHHAQGATTGSADAMAARPRLPIHMDERNKLHIVRDTGAWRLPVAIPATLALLTLRFAPRGAWRQWRWALNGWWDGVRGRRGPPNWLPTER